MRSFSFYFFLTAIFGVGPFLIYYLEKIYGVLTTPDEWYVNGGNHGPWRYGPEGIMLYTPIFFLIMVTVVRFIPAKNKIKFGCLILAQIFLLLAQFWFLHWTVD